jgi:hypothetical protein
MRLTELKRALLGRGGMPVRFVLPDGEVVAAHAHVTEVARVDKRFIDCGGTLRTDSMCRLQTWVADDVDHRLTAGKLLGILEKAAAVLGADDMEVDVEHEVQWISQFPLERVEAGVGEVRLVLGVRHTDCLAKDKCQPQPASPVGIAFRSAREFRPVNLSANRTA